MKSFSKFGGGGFKKDPLVEQLMDRHKLATFSRPPQFGRMEMQPKIKPFASLNRGLSIGKPGSF